jgi:hypothetical protein
MAVFVRASLRKRLFRLLALGLLASGTAIRPTFAVVITAVDPGSIWRNSHVFGTPQTSQSGVSQSALLAMADAAGDYWESLILDPFTMNIEVGFTNRIGGATAAAALGRNSGNAPGLIAVTSAPLPFFVDPTPFDNSEYAETVTTFQDLGGGLLNTGFGFRGPTAAAAGIDLFTILLHEIGHTLGVDLIIDGAIMVPSSLPFAGSVIPIHTAGGRVTGHLALPQALMNPSAGLLGPDPLKRTLPSDADILAAATEGRFQNVRLNEFVPVDEPGAMAVLSAACAVVVAFRSRRKHVRSDRV